MYTPCTWHQMLKITSTLTADSSIPSKYML